MYWDFVIYITILVYRFSSKIGIAFLILFCGKVLYLAIK
jgi:hypothetical protein